MINKKLELNLGEQKVQLWFNNYAVFELQKMYGAEQSEILNKVSQRAQDNYLLLMSDLIKVGIKGQCLAKGIETPKIYNELGEHLAVANIEELMQVWVVFMEHMGVNIEHDKKKVIPKKATKKK